MGPHSRRSRLSQLLLASTFLTALLLASGCTTYASYGRTHRCWYGGCSRGVYDPYYRGGYGAHPYGHRRTGPWLGARPYPVYVPVYRDWDDDHHHGRDDWHRGVRDRDRDQHRSWDGEKYDRNLEPYRVERPRPVKPERPRAWRPQQRAHPNEAEPWTRGDRVPRGTPGVPRGHWFPRGKPSR